MNLPKIPLDGNAPFDNAARLYRDAGLHPVPCEDKRPTQQCDGIFNAIFISDENVERIAVEDDAIGLFDLAGVEQD